LGGVFFKAENPEKLYEWYEKQLGVKQDVPGQGVSFRWKEDGDPEGCTVRSIFKPGTKHFQPSTKPFMLNFRVEDLGARPKIEFLKTNPSREAPHIGLSDTVRVR
jgi:hypothetical protein